MHPEVINQDPFGEGWLCEVELNDWETDQSRLLDATAYFEMMKREAEEEVKKYMNKIQTKSCHCPMQRHW